MTVTTPSLQLTPKKTNDWALNKAGVRKELLNTIKAKKLAYYGHSMREQGSCLEKDIMQGTMPRAQPAWMDNTWTGLTMEGLIRMAED